MHIYKEYVVAARTGSNRFFFGSVQCGFFILKARTATDSSVFLRFGPVQLRFFSGCMNRTFKHYMPRTEIKPKIVRYSDRYPDQKAEAIRTQKTPLDHNYQKEVAEKDNPYAPFISKMDWELGKWGNM